MKRVQPCLFFVFAILASAATAQDTLHTGFEVIAHLPGARALAVDPEDMIYVVTPSEVVKLDPMGVEELRLDGTNTGRFADLSDVDPGNGLIWIVADEENGTLLRFSKELLHLETIRVPRNTAVELGRSPHVDLDDGFSTALGQPIAVAGGPNGALFAIDAFSQRVLKWDASRRLERVIGEFGTGYGQLIEPVSLATTPTTLYVADRNLASIKVFDYFGGHLKNIQAQQNLRSIIATETELWVTYPKEIWIYTHEAKLSHQIVVVLDESLIATAPVSDYLVLLTTNQLLRINLPDE